GRALLAVYAGAVAPFRAVHGGSDVMLRYTAATAGGTGVTLALLLLMTLLLPPTASGIDFPKGDRVIVRPKVDESFGLRHRTPVGEPRAAPAVRPQGGRSEPAGNRARSELRWIPAARPSTAEPAFAFAAPPAVEPFRTNRPAIEPGFSASDTRAFVGMLQPTLDLSSFRPVARTPPSYPPFAARRGIEGYVVVEYTVTRHGEVHAPLIVESSSSIFHEAALEAASG